MGKATYQTLNPCLVEAVNVGSGWVVGFPPHASIAGSVTHELGVISSCTIWDADHLSTLSDHGLFGFLMQSGDKLDYNPLCGGSPFPLSHRLLVYGYVLPSISRKESVFTPPLPTVKMCHGFIVEEEPLFCNVGGCV